MAIDQNMQSIPRNTYTSLNTLAKIVAGVFIILLVVYVISFVSNTMQAGMIQKFLDGGYISPAEADANDSRQYMIWVAQVILIIATAIVFLIWVYRANKNLKVLGTIETKFTPGWSVGWFFVPLANLYRPYEVVHEIWEESDSGNSLDPALPYRHTSSALVGWWWALFLIGNFASSFAGRFPLGDTADGLLNSTRLFQVSDIIEIVGIVLTVWMVLKISQLQEMKYKQIPAPQTEASFGSLQY